VTAFWTRGRILSGFHKAAHVAMVLAALLGVVSAGKQGGAGTFLLIVRLSRDGGTMEARSSILRQTEAEESPAVALYLPGQEVVGWEAPDVLCPPCHLAIE
jgi:hypothetical protein